MEVVPASVGEASRRWDDERLHLQSAADGIGAAPTDGFTGEVAGTAGRFTAAWTRLASDLGQDCERRADGLRAALAEAVSADEDAAAALVPYLRELR